MNDRTVFFASILHLALGYACESGNTKVAEVLLNSGARIDDAENEGRTPIMKAARAGHICTVRYLISKGRDHLRVFSFTILDYNLSRS